MYTIILIPTDASELARKAPGLSRITSGFCLVVALAAVFALSFAPKAEGDADSSRTTD
jgi:hypothetical protein